MTEVEAELNSFPFPDRVTSVQAISAPARDDCGPNRVLHDHRAANGDEQATGAASTSAERHPARSLGAVAIGYRATGGNLRSADRLLRPGRSRGGQGVLGGVLHRAARWRRRQPFPGGLGRHESELKNSVSGVWVTHLGWCPSHTDDSVHGHFYGMRPLRGSDVAPPGTPARPNSCLGKQGNWSRTCSIGRHSKLLPVGVGRKDVLRVTLREVNSRRRWRGLGIGGPGPQGHRGEGRIRAENPCGRGRDRAIRCPVCGDDVPRGSWHAFRSSPGGS